MAAATSRGKVNAAIRFTHHAENLSLNQHREGDARSKDTTAVEARFITPRDPVIETANGERLPAVPLAEAQKLNKLKDEFLGHDGVQDRASRGNTKQENREIHNEKQAPRLNEADNAEQDGVEGGDDVARGLFSTDTEEPGAEAEGFGRTAVPLSSAIPPSRTNPLFPPLPLYGPPNLARDIQCLMFRFTSFWLSMAFLAAIVVGSAVTSIPMGLKSLGIRLTGKNPSARRPFFEEEKRRAAARQREEAAWTRKERRRRSSSSSDEKDVEADGAISSEEFVPTEGGSDPLICDPAYYARRVGLDLEEYDVQTEDGFIISLWHIYDPREYTPASAEERRQRKPEVFPESATCDPTASPCAARRKSKYKDAPVRYPVLLIHGLLQSAGAYCTNDDASLAFYLAKSGYDVWLGNNRCGFRPRHTLLKYSDPRLWAFNIRQMGVMDLPALMSRVLSETGFPRLGLVCHSQGTTQTFVALAKEQRPDLGKRISVFCALAPAVYAGSLIDKAYFKFMKVISPAWFRIVFGIHAFIPLMMTVHRWLPGKLCGAIGYRVFSFLFDWTDDRWDRGLRDRLFQFAPVYVSAESMRWWLGRECFAKHKCILATHEEWRREDEEDQLDDLEHQRLQKADTDSSLETRASDGDVEKHAGSGQDRAKDHGARAWYDEQAPKMAFWVAGADKLVDGRRLLRRFERGREPHVRVVHAKVIPEYEHLDVLWAIDAIEKVGCEVKDVIWKTAEVGPEVAVPKGCEMLRGRTRSNDGSFYSNSSGFYGGTFKRKRIGVQ